VIAETHLSFEFLLFFYVVESIGQLKIGLVGGVIVHWDGKVGRVLLLPFVVLHDFVDIGLAQNFNIVPCLLYV
jgi:hypothetical protein